MKNVFPSGSRILFQGDSITDCDRDRESPSCLGHGYAARAARLYDTLFPGSGVTFLNRGVSGNRVCDLLARYEEDLRDLRPDVLSILIGINDVWRRYDSSDPTSAGQFEETYRRLLEKVRRDLPHTKILMMEPFVLHSLPDRAGWHEDLDPKIQVVRTLAREYADWFLPADGLLAGYQVQGCAPAALAEDGVHPTDIGHGILAGEWLRAVGALV